MNKLNLNDMLAKTGKRKEAFELMVSHCRQCELPLIVETGVCRQEDNYDGDGMSTLIWDAVANERMGTVQAIDIKPENCAFARGRVSNRTMIYCGDSVDFLQSKELELYKLTRKIDLLYLDSYDLDINNWHPSALHHLMELLAIKGALKSGTLICVDDNLIINNNFVGKGAYVADAMTRLGKQEIYTGYQRIWRW